MKNVIIAVVSLLIGASLGYWITMKNLRHEIKIEQNDTKNDFAPINLITGKEAYTYIDNYKSAYSKTLKKVYNKDSVTNSVWFDTSFVYFMNDALKTEGKHSGVRVYLGQYNKMQQNIPGQCSPTQLSLFFIATNKNIIKGTHQDDTSFFKPPNSLSVLNHGSLCPKICD